MVTRYAGCLLITGAYGLSYDGAGMVEKWPDAGAMPLTARWRTMGTGQGLGPCETRAGAGGGDRGGDRIRIGYASQRRDRSRQTARTNNVSCCRSGG